MNTPADLFAIAYKKELAASRRLAKSTGLSAQAALLQVLQTAAQARPLAELLAIRQQEKNDAAARIALRKQQKAEALADKIAAAQPDPTAWLAWFDGATHPNPGKMGIGGVLKSPAGDITTVSYAAGQGDSNEAEYIALIAILQAAVAAGAAKLVIHGDSRVVLDDVQTETAGIAVLHMQRMQAKQLLSLLNDVSFRWIPRTKNSMADALSQQAVMQQAVKLTSIYSAS